MKKLIEIYVVFAFLRQNVFIIMTVLYLLFKFKSNNAAETVTGRLISSKTMELEFSVVVYFVIISEKF